MILEVGSVRRVIQTSAAVGWATVLLVGLPAGLIHLGAAPWRAHLPDRQALTGWLAQPPTLGLALAALAGAGWLLWAVLVALLLAEAARQSVRLPTRIARRALERVRLPGPVQGLSAAVLGTVAVTTATTSPAAAAGTHHAVVATAVPTGRAPATGPPPATTGPPPTRSPVPAGRSHRTYTVRRHDTLWDIAAARLGDPTRWPQIYQLNRDRYDQHGRMNHGDHIEPGWVLALPDGARPPASTRPAPPPPNTGASTTPPLASSSPSAVSPTVTAPPSATPTTATDTDDDGIIIPTPTRTPPAAQPDRPPPSPTTATSGSASPTPAPAGHHNTDDHGGPGIQLPGGGWVTAPLAAAVAAAAALVWIQRRRRYRPRSPAGGDHQDPDLTPLPRTIAALHRTPPVPSLDTDAEDESMAHREHLEPQAQQAATATTAAVGTHANRHLRLPDLPTHGVGLTGPGAQHAARGILATALSAGGPWTPSEEATITTTTTDLATLLGPDAADRYPVERLHLANSIDDALTHLERQLLRRARLATDHAGSDLTTLHPDDPHQPPPPIVFLATAPDGPIAAALAAILAVGSRLAITAVLLGPWPTGATWHVNTDGTTRPNPAADTAGPRLNVLDTAATTDILNTLTQARPPATTFHLHPRRRAQRRSCTPPQRDPRRRPPQHNRPRSTPTTARRRLPPNPPTPTATHRPRQAPHPPTAPGYA
jgi:hypothetical protein